MKSYMKESKQKKKWSEKVMIWRINWFGHLSRLPEKWPAKHALYKALRQAKRLKGGTTNNLAENHE